MWTDGNFACDYNRSLVIQRQCDPDVLDLDCGEDVILLALEALGDTHSDA
jgi:hypothetical protein